MISDGQCCKWQKSILYSIGLSDLRSVSIQFGRISRRLPSNSRIIIPGGVSIIQFYHISVCSIHCVMKNEHLAVIVYQMNINCYTFVYFNKVILFTVQAGFISKFWNRDKT